jgi:hypothetical protein
MATMPSPLPDASNLEAGIVEDASPSRLSRVHNNVRDLLRRSVFGAVANSPVASPVHSPQDRVFPYPTLRPATQRPSHQATPTGFTTSPSEDVPGVLFPSWRRQPLVSPVANTTTRPQSPREHPDLSQNAMSDFLRQEELQQHQRRQNKAWKRHRSRRSRKPVSSIQRIICIILGLTVLGLLGTCKKPQQSRDRTNRMLTTRRHRTCNHILAHLSITARPLRARLTPHKYRLRPHTSQTMLSAFSTREKAHRTHRASTATETVSSSTRHRSNNQHLRSLHSSYSHTSSEPRFRVI